MWKGRRLTLKCQIAQLRIEGPSSAAGFHPQSFCLNVSSPSFDHLVFLSNNRIPKPIGIFQLRIMCSTGRKALKPALSHRAKKHVNLTASTSPDNCPLDDDIGQMTMTCEDSNPDDFASLDLGSDSGDMASPVSESVDSSSSSISNLSYVSAALTVYQRQVMDSLMEEVRSLLDRGSGVRHRPSGRMSNRDSADSQPSSEGSSSHGLGRGQGVGNRNGNNEGQAAARGSGDGSPNDEESQPMDTNPPLARRSACPYYKRQPWKHTKRRSCASPG
ncbi:hypothetical protein B0H63DRAFT_83781 [Podospora didyma]|uniref:Uncharacterized protein n=1 Tax=Podospora didyma TaxID=330526 RepID=A0AAE0N2C0_9PEZI|nr:hypothetical protein B0H63DRAFT_83781 [Podospora didyma]